MSLNKSSVIRPEDSKEYISYQFKTLKDTLRTFDYVGLSEIINAAHHVFMDSSAEQHSRPDTILLDFDSQSKT